MDDKGVRCANCGMWVLCPTCNNIIHGRRITAIYGKYLPETETYESERLFCTAECKEEYKKKRKID
jgi:hypothetical protein